MTDTPETPQPRSDATTIPADQTPLARILAHDTAYWSCVAAVEHRSSWMLVHDAAFVGRIDPNHAGHFRAPEGTGPVIVQTIIAFYEALGAPPAAYVDALATPRDLVPALLAAGFRDWPGAANDLLLYVGPDMERPASHPVGVTETAAAQAAWAAIVDDGADRHTRQQLTQLNAREIADPRVTAYLAHVEGHPVARGHLFTRDGLGRVEAVYTRAAVRGRGLAAADRPAGSAGLDRAGQCAHLHLRRTGWGGTAPLYPPRVPTGGAERDPRLSALRFRAHQPGDSVRAPLMGRCPLCR